MGTAATNAITTLGCPFLPVVRWHREPEAPIHPAHLPPTAWPGASLLCSPSLVFPLHLVCRPQIQPTWLWDPALLSPSPAPDPCVQDPRSPPLHAMGRSPGTRTQSSSAFPWCPIGHLEMIISKIRTTAPSPTRCLITIYFLSLFLALLVNTSWPLHSSKYFTFKLHLYPRPSRHTLTPRSGSLTALNAVPRHKKFFIK